MRHDLTGVILVEISRLPCNAVVTSQADWAGARWQWVAGVYFPTLISGLELNYHDAESILFPS
jgi:hypothetical protein